MIIEYTRELARSLYRRTRWLIQRLRGIAPSLQVSPHNYKLITLGSNYGAWTFVDDTRLNDSLVLSCGLGEDASFDVEFASRYGARVLLVDPTPRAIDHFNGILSRMGKASTSKYSLTGAQPSEAYDLSKLRSDQLVLCKKALWNHRGKLRFFAPADPFHVSHSILNYQHNYAADTSYIEVDAITMQDLVDEYNLGQIPLLKLDIEGAEVEVLLSMLQAAVYPDQVLVEYDELSVPSKTAKERVESAHNALKRAGYQLIHRQRTNFTYVRLAAPIDRLEGSRLRPAESARLDHGATRGTRPHRKLATAYNQVRLHLSLGYRTSAASELHHEHLSSNQRVNLQEPLVRKNPGRSLFTSA